MAALDQLRSIENLKRAWRWIQSNADASYKSYFRSLYQHYAVAEDALLADLSSRLKRGIYDEANQVYEHGGHWLERVRRLGKHELLPDAMLFAVKVPAPTDTAVRRAADEIVSDLREAGVVVAEAADATAIVQFAAGVKAH